MALKRPNNMLAAFSMASMTDVIFLLLVFFMVTSTFVFPTALEINLPQGTEQQALKPGTRVYVDADGAYFISVEGRDLQPVAADSLQIALMQAAMTDSVSAVAVYADVAVPYGKVVEVLNTGAAASLKMVLATTPIAHPAPEGFDTSDAQRVGLDTDFQPTTPQQ